jgi:hypothetical protein
MALASQQQSALTVAEWPVGHVLMAMASAVSVSYLPSSMAAWISHTSPVVIDIIKCNPCVFFIKFFFWTEINLLWKGAM